MAGKTSRCESIYSSFEQLKEFKIDKKRKTFRKVLKRPNTLLLGFFLCNTKYFTKTIMIDLVTL